MLGRLLHFLRLGFLKKLRQGCCMGCGGVPLGPSPHNLKEGAMEWQLIGDALLTAFGIIGILLVVFFSCVIVCFLAHEVCWSIKERRRRRDMQWKA